MRVKNFFQEKIFYFKDQISNEYSENKKLLNPLFYILLVCLALWLLIPTTSDFGLNAFTETLGIIVTVILVDKIIRKREEERILPLKIAAYKDVKKLTADILSFWFTIYKESVDEPFPETIEEFFQEDNLKKIAAHLNLDGIPNVTPSRTWWEYLPQLGNQMKQDAERILERHVQNLEPEVYSMIHEQLSLGILSNIGIRQITAIKQSDIEHRTPRPRNLGGYFPIIADRYSKIIELYNWCNQYSAYLNSMNADTINSIIKYPNGQQTSPKSRFTLEQLVDQTIAYRNWQQNSRADNA